MYVDACEADGGLRADAATDLDAFSLCRWAVFSRAAWLGSVSWRPDELRRDKGPKETESVGVVTVAKPLIESSCVFRSACSAVQQP